MSIERLQKAFELEKRFLNVQEKICPDYVIEKAEELLNVKFPPSYKYFAKHISLTTKTPILGPDQDENGNIYDPIGLESVTNTFRASNKSYPLKQQYILIDIDAPTYKHVLDTTRITENGESPVIRWGAGEYFDSEYDDLDGLYLELVNGEIYIMMTNKADKNQLYRKEVEEYLNFYLFLGFKGNEDPFLEKHFKELLEMAK